MISGIHKTLIHWADLFREDPVDPTHQANAETVPSMSFASNWHDDHWRSFLSCPIDAGRYFVDNLATPGNAEAEQDEAPRLDSFSGRLIRHYS